MSWPYAAAASVLIMAAYLTILSFRYLSLRRSYSRLLESPGMFDEESRRALETKLEHQAFHDDLTGLANRPLVLDRLSSALAQAGAAAASAA